MSNICISLPYGDRYNVDCGKLVEVIFEVIVDSLDSTLFSINRDWINSLRIFLGEGKEHFSGILLGVKTAKGLFEYRLPINIFIPSENPPFPR
jgi:hypothetical protein